MGALHHAHGPPKPRYTLRPAKGEDAPNEICPLLGSKLHVALLVKVEILKARKRLRRVEPVQHKLAPVHRRQRKVAVRVRDISLGILHLVPRLQEPHRLLGGVVDVLELPRRALAQVVPHLRNLVQREMPPGREAHVLAQTPPRHLPLDPVERVHPDLGLLFPLLRLGKEKRLVDPEKAMVLLKVRTRAVSVHPALVELGLQLQPPRLEHVEIHRRVRAVLLVERPLQRQPERAEPARLLERGDLVHDALVVELARLEQQTRVGDERPPLDLHARRQATRSPWQQVLLLDRLPTRPLLRRDVVHTGLVAPELVQAADLLLPRSVRLQRPKRLHRRCPARRVLRRAHRQQHRQRRRRPPHRRARVQAPPT